jgi:hypothetical protein
MQVIKKIGNLMEALFLLFIIIPMALIICNFGGNDEWPEMGD